MRVYALAFLHYPSIIPVYGCVWERRKRKCNHGKMDQSVEWTKKLSMCWLPFQQKQYNKLEQLNSEQRGTFSEQPLQTLGRTDQVLSDCYKNGLRGWVLCRKFCKRIVCLMKRRSKGKWGCHSELIQLIKAVSTCLRVYSLARFLGTVNE